MPRTQQQAARHFGLQFEPVTDKQNHRMYQTTKPVPDFELHCGDASEVLHDFSDDTIDLIVTSPPYAERRKSTYGGIHADDYVDWFLGISEEMLRVLKPSGSFVLNIKEHAINGERHPYVLELILGLRSQGWLWTEEYMWHKKNSYPGKWPNRFRDAWERLLHFNKTRRFKMNQEEVMVPMGDWTGNRLLNLSETDRVRDESRVGSGFGTTIGSAARWLILPMFCTWQRNAGIEVTVQRFPNLYQVGLSGCSQTQVT